MTDTRDDVARCSRRALGATLALGAFGVLATSGCSDAEWLERRDLASFELPRRLPIMVFKSARVRALDRDGYSDAVASELGAALAERGIRTDIIELAGAPRLPRIELAFNAIELAREPRGLEGTTFLEGGSITVDCAFVSARDEVAFIGRVKAPGKDGNLGLGAEAAAHAIAKALLHG